MLVVFSAPPLPLIPLSHHSISVLPTNISVSISVYSIPHTFSLPSCPTIFQFPAFYTVSADCTFKLQALQYHDTMSLAHLSMLQYISFSLSLQVWMSCGCREDITCFRVGHINRKCVLCMLPGGIILRRATLCTLCCKKLTLCIIPVTHHLKQYWRRSLFFYEAHFSSHNENYNKYNLHLFHPHNLIYSTSMERGNDAILPNLLSRLLFLSPANSILASVSKYNVNHCVYS